MIQNSSREKISNLILLASLALLVIVFRFTTLALQQKEVYLSVSLLSEKAGITQVFYNTGKGYNEKESIQKELFATANKQKITFKLPENKLVSFRFDPINKTGKVKLIQSQLVTQSGQTIQEIDFKKWKATANCELAMDQNILTITTPKIEDPQLTIPVEILHQTTFGNQVYLKDAFLCGGYALIIAIAFSLISILFLGQSLYSTVKRLPEYIRKNLYLINKPE